MIVIRYKRKYYDDEEVKVKVYYSFDKKYKVVVKDPDAQTYLYAYKDDDLKRPIALILLITISELQDDNSYKIIGEYERIWYDKKVSMTYQKNFINKFLLDPEYRAQYKVKGHNVDIPIDV